ncbi:MAG: hypothetical protein UU14_C0028G0008 [Candidatus Roizmanbacteria bacterium GW2011_GWB1_40_7]|uniref:Uncharacterized protein n=2 Tax=Candidatus Roizmaniibacteriota TaxID=1752723 RepID=A0A0G0T9F4_9BACT|nr:MAG: hypothetical protein UU14_C0028G0008 [Candidatus Roizmanbacteria bacterium GW2011_GWB1_40_7]KKR92789.1 MAG: hypothetical protein UU41_C0024G0007 [Candidatus Roizmanbacteria bacterium GW2011_GWA1_41_13]
MFHATIPYEMNKRKFIVTHANPDQDAVSSIWLIKRFWAGWENTEILSVPAGETLDSFRQKDSNIYSTISTEKSDIVHVDTGFGEFDHHQTNDDTCAAKLVFEKTIKNKSGKKIKIDEVEFTVKKANYEVLERMISFINEIDHFREVYYPEANNDRYQFLLSGILDGLNLMYNSTGVGDVQVVSFGMTALDGVYRLLQNKIGAEKEIEERTSVVIPTKFGDAIGFETSNDAVLDISQKNGYAITVRKDPNKQYIRLKCLPEKGIDLTPIYNELKQRDPEASWFLHASRAMVLNGSTKNPSMKPTTLSLDEIMEVIKKEFS